MPATTKEPTATTTLAPVEAAAPLAATRSDLGQFGIEGLEGVGQQDIVLPRWTVVQPTSKYDGADDHLGYFRKNLDGSFAKELDVVVLLCNAERILWSGDQSETRPECVSRDTVHGSLPRTEDGMYGSCATCVFNPQFNREVMDQRQAGVQVKACGYGYKMMIADVAEPHSVALFGAMGTSVRPIKTLISQFVEKRTSPFAAVVRFATEKVVNDRGKFYVLQPTIVRWFNDPKNPDRAAFDTFRALYQAYKGANVKEVGEDDEAADDGAEAPPF